MALLKTYTISTDVTAGVVGSDVLHKELADSGDITNFTSINIIDDSLEVWGDTFVSEANVDATVLAHVAVPLANLKARRYGEIDLKTRGLILTGFTYDSASFSASAMAQQNWSSIKENTSDYTFPLVVSTLDNNEYSLAEANVTAFWTAGRDHVKGHLDSGRSLKKSVFDAVDKAAVDAVVDNR